MASVLEEVAAHYAAMVEVATLETVTFAVAFAVLETVAVFAFIAVVQLAVVALREVAAISAVVFVAHGRCAIIKVSGRGVPILRPPGPRWALKPGAGPPPWALKPPPPAGAAAKPPPPPWPPPPPPPPP